MCKSRKTNFKTYALCFSECVKIAGKELKLETFLLKYHGIVKEHLNLLLYPKENGMFRIFRARCCLCMPKE